MLATREPSTEVALDGALVLIELKRDRAPRGVVAQAIDYACWVEGLEAYSMGPESTVMNAAVTPSVDFRISKTFGWDTPPRQEG